MLNELGDLSPALDDLGYAFTGPSFQLKADGRAFTPSTMTATGPHEWQDGAVTVKLAYSATGDGSRSVVLEATGVRRVDEVCLLDHDIEPAPAEIHNHRWFDMLGMQQSTAVFLRDQDGGVFASWANPFGRAEIEGNHLRLWYRPAMDVPSSRFRSDPLVVGTWRRTGREARFDALPGRDIANGVEPAYIGMIAADRPVVLDAGEIAAVRAAVAERVPWSPARPRVAHWDWGENLYRLDRAEPETVAIYDRVAQFCAEIGVEVMLVAPGSAPPNSPSTEGPWQNIMWLSMGESVGHGRWQPGAEPAGVRDLVATVRKHGVGVAAYVNPQFPWLADPRWRVEPPAGEPDKYGHADLACLAVPAAREWLVERLRAFITEYDLEGVSLDFVVWQDCHANDHPHEPGADSTYAQWDGYRRLLADLREDRDLWVECLIGSSNVLPWGALDMTHPTPFACDNQPQWVPAWPDLSLDRTYAHLQRRSAWWYRNLAFTPSPKVPGGVGHQANRLHELPVERGWDWDGARFNLLAAIASGPSSLAFSFLPGWDEAEWDAVRERDGAFFRTWIRFAKDHADVLARLTDLYDEPRPGAVDGTMAVDEHGHGFAFLVNPDFSDHRVEVPVPAGRLMRELHPETGRLWDSSVVVEGRQVHVLELVDDASVPRPALIGASGSAGANGKVTAAGGRPGSVARVEARLTDAATVPAVLVFHEDGVSSSVGPWRDGDDVVALPDVAANVRLWAEWSPGTALPELLAGLAPPVAPTDEQDLQPWSDPSRLRLLIDLTDPQAVEVRATVDGAEVPVRRAYVGTWEDVKDSEIFPLDHNLLGHYLDLTDMLKSAAAAGTLDAPWRIELTLDGVAAGSFRGVHVAHLPRRTTTSFAAVELLGSPALEAAVDVPSEAPVLPGTTLAQVLLQHSWRGNPVGATLERDVVYGTGGEHELRLSVYRRDDSSERRPAVVFVHGGGWAGGDAYFHARHAQALAAEGYVTANIDYRLHPATTWEGALGDVKCAVRWLRAHADELGADPDRIAIVGGSAGGHLAAMAAMTPGRWEGIGGHDSHPSDVQAAVLFYPAVDLDVVYEIAPPLIRGVMEPYFGDDRVTASPVSHLSRDCPPVLTITGSADPMVPAETIGAFHEALTRAEVPNRLEVFDGESHAFDLVSERRWQETTDLMTAFLAEHL